jgi:hypothetical protein
MLFKAAASFCVYLEERGVSGRVYFNPKPSPRDQNISFDFEKQKN